MLQKVVLWNRMVSSAILLAAIFARPSLAQKYTFTHLAGGGGSGFEDGHGDEARFFFSRANLLVDIAPVAIDSAGNVFVADTYNHTIRKINTAGEVTTLAGLAGSPGNTDGKGSAARFALPGGIATDTAGNVYVADTDNHTIRKINRAGEVTTLAGLAGVSGSNDGIGSVARFNGPTGVATDTAGNVYVVDTFNLTIRRIASGGEVTTLAGLARSFGSSDGRGSEARFSWPIGVACDREGNVYIADNRTIRKITNAGDVTTLAGSPGSSGTSDGTGSAARFDRPSGVATDAAGDLYVADRSNHTVRKITRAGQVTTLAGLARSPGSSDGIGSGARFHYPSGVAMDFAGNIYVADILSQTIRKISAAGHVTTLAGLAGSSGSRDGSGSAAQFLLPSGVATDADGTVYVADRNNHTIRKVTSAGAVTTFAGAAGSFGSENGTGSAARFFFPTAVATNSAGNVYVADSANHVIRKITRAGEVTTLAGQAGSSGNADGMGNAARFSGPAGIATDSAGNIYVADTGNHTVRRITNAGEVTTFAGLASTPGSVDGTGSAARFSGPVSVATDNLGNVYVADVGNHTIRKITSGGQVTALAGKPGVSGSSDGIGSAARFDSPSGVAADAAGNVYVADQWNHTIRKVTSAGHVSTLAGLAGWGGASEGTENAARFMNPLGVATDSAGNVYVADSGNNIIRAGRPALSESATVDTDGPAGATRQLNTTAQSASSWQWSVIRRPAGSVAQLTSSTIRNPRFTPDIADEFVFRLTASNGTQTSITIVEMNVAPAPPRRRAVRH